MHKQRLHSTFGILAAIAFSLLSLGLRSQTCLDTIQYVMYKNSGGTGGYVLVAGSEEWAAQTYHLTSSATLRGMRVYGTRLTGQLEMRALVFHSNSSNLPTSPIDSTAWSTWGAANQSQGYKDFGFNRALADSFACVIQMRTISGTPQFQITYNGDGEGRGENLAAVSGPATSGSWQSILPVPRNRNGDLYLLPVLEFPVSAAFTSASYCLATAEDMPLLSTGLAAICTDSMMNTSMLAGYGGSFDPYRWIAAGAAFTAGSSASANPTLQYNAPGCNSLSLVVTHDGWTNLCADTATVTVSVGLAVSLTLSDSSSCNTANAGYTPNGSLQLLGSGGCPSYQFYLSLGGSPLDTLASAGAVTFSSMAPGTYQVIAADASTMYPGGCRDTASFAVEQPNLLSIDSSDATLATCSVSNGTLTLYASGGTGSLLYAVDAGSPSGSPSFTGLAGGPHLFTVTDANGCGTSDSLVVPQNPGPDLSLVAVTPTTCPLGDDGVIILSAAGGLGTLQFDLSTTPPQASGTFGGLTAGSYTAYVVDSTACVDSLTGIVVAQPPLFDRMVNVTHVSCNGLSDGSIAFMGSTGGTGSHTFSLDGGTYQPTPFFGALAAGSYTIVTRDSVGCTDTTEVLVTEPNSLVIDSVRVQHLSCFGSMDGLIEVIPMGGTPPYSYQINASVFVSGSIFSPLNAGSYLMTVRDFNGCLTDTTIVLTQPPVIAASITPTATTCGSSVGSIYVTASGGSGSGYTFSIDSVTFITPGIFTGLPAGTYNVWVKDDNDCIRKFGTTILNTGGPTITGHSSTNITCHGEADGTVTVSSVTGGSGVLQYNVDGGTYSTSPAFTGLLAGLHDVVVRDGLGCTDTLEVELFEPAEILIVPTLYDVSCNGNADGAISIFAAGGVGSFQYSLDGAVYQPVPFFSGLSAGPYTIRVRDGGGCIDTLTVTVAEPFSLNLSGSWTDVSCFGMNDGTLLMSGSGGITPYEYSLDGSTWQDSALFVGLDGGAYFVQLRDSNLCITTTPMVVGEPSELALAASITNATDCATATDGEIDLFVVGGNAPYGFDWDGPGGFSSTLEDPTGLAVGFYFVHVTDTLGCEVLDTFEVTCATLQSASASGTFSIYPNPVQDVLHIRSPWAGDFHYEVIDLRGVVVLRGSGTRHEQFSVAELPRGAYAVRVWAEQGRTTRRVVVE